MILGKKLSGGVIALILLFGLNPSGYSGFLGYTQKPSMPEGIQTIYIDTIQNAIRVDEIYAYEPGLEIEITNAIIRRLHRDGNLRVVPREKADAILEAKLIHFEQEGVRFSKIESVEEFRLYIILSMRLVNGKTNEVMWEEPHFSGNTEYFISQIRSIAREEATRVAIERLARNVVDRIVEDW
ncbi:MAG TPA: LptE family protein [bacterium]|nr:LptE family protein [bacterium]